MNDDKRTTTSPTPSARSIPRGYDEHDDARGQQDSGPLSIEDFVAFPPNNTFIYLPCREQWSAAAIDKVLPPQQDLDANGQPLRRLGKAVMIKASTWLMRYRRVEQISW